jgi:hypothetical protein
VDLHAHGWLPRNATKDVPRAQPALFVIAGLDPAIILERHEMRGSSPRMTVSLWEQLSLNRQGAID